MPRLNVFQRLSSQWEVAHPYNAAQYCSLHANITTQQLQAAWLQTVRELSLGILSPSDTGTLPGCPPSLIQTDQIESHVSSQLNVPFSDTELPFRPFVSVEPSGHTLGIIYRHKFADSYSVRLIMRHWIALSTGSTPPHASVKFANQGYWSLFGPHVAGWSLSNGLARAVRWTAELKRIRRLEPGSAANLAVAFTNSSSGDISASMLRYASRMQYDATVGDVLLAALLEAAADHLPIPLTARRRRLAAGSIVDLRPYAKEDLSSTLGLFLGFLTVCLDTSACKNFSQKVTAVSAQTRAFQRHRSAPASMIRFLPGLLAGKLCHRPSSPTSLAEFYRRRLPLAAGLSNVNLNPSWANAALTSSVSRYVRVSPAGPLMPLVLSVTTLGDDLQLGITHRLSVIPPHLAQLISQQITERLHRVIDAARLSQNSLSDPKQLPASSYYMH